MGVWGTAGMADAGGAGAVVRPERLGAVLVLVIDAPPVNALGHALRAALWDGLAMAEADPGVSAVVLAAEGRTFPVGADITEFGQPPRAPLLPDLCDRIEGCAKPVVAALHGTALGGGLELALAARGRVMARGATVGLPEVKLGLLPGAGGTQRLPRLVGAKAALDMMLDGGAVGAEAAQAMGLVDILAEAEVLVETAVALAEVLAERPVLPTRDRTEGLRDPVAYAAAVAAAREVAGEAPTEAPARIVDCVEAALLLPFVQGLAFERAAFGDLVGSDAAMALRHVFLAERRAVRGFAAVALCSVTVVGAGSRGADLAWDLLKAGLAVTLADADQDRLVPGLQRIAAAAEAAVESGRMSAAARDDAWGRLSPALADDPGVAAADAVVLAGDFAHGTVQAVPALRGGAAPVILLGGGEGLRLHLVPGTRLAEVLAPEASSAAAVAAAVGLARRLGRVAVVTRSAAGLAGPMAAVLAAAAAHLALRHGQAAVEGALAAWSLAVPVLAGDGRVPARRADIQRALIAALANLGLRMLGQEAVRRPSDVDVAAVQGLGWPPHVPGPMLWAERRGMLVVRADLAGFAALDAGLWQAAPLIDHLIAEGLPLSALDGAGDAA
ncbi:MAG: enoyl-CoA hydratase-related protein [Gemmobacter sp.]